VHCDLLKFITFVLLNYQCVCVIRLKLAAGDVCLIFTLAYVWSIRLRRHCLLKYVSTTLRNLSFQVLKLVNGPCLTS
jgi:hypothetical protein